MTVHLPYKRYTIHKKIYKMPKPVLSNTPLKRIGLNDCLGLRHEDTQE